MAAPEASAKTAGRATESSAASSSGSAAFAAGAPPLRVAFFTQGVTVAAARFRAAQIAPRLEAAGVGCTLLPARPSVYGDTGIGWAHGWRRELFRPLSVLSRASQLHRVAGHDVVYFQRPMVEYFSTLFEEVLARARPAVFDMDDAIFHNLWGLTRFKIRRIVSLVRHVVVGNRYLAEFVDAPERTTIIPTVVDAERYRPRPDPDGQFTIGWTGYASNLKELYPLRDALRAVLRETSGRLLIIAESCDAPWLRDLPVEHVRWSPEVEVRALAGAHVGLMPLADTPYNRGKCGFKLIQYMARGMPTVTTPVGANADIVRDGVEGFHAVTPDQWRDALMRLSRDPDLRDRIGRAGRERVEQSYSVEAVVPLYLEVLRRVVS